MRLVAVFDQANVPSPFPEVPFFVSKAGFSRWCTSSPARPVGFLVAIGGDRGRDRLAIHEELEAAGLSPLIARHPTAFIASSAKIGDGSQILAMAAVAVDAILGRGVIVNTSASVDHECVLGDGVHIAPGARLAGCVVVGRFAMVGTGAVVLPRVRIGEDAIVGAGAVVTKDVAAGAVVAGNPARTMPRTPDD
jgi:sugar O-acyltransferase (sialic acid O-acetyltransferase NeuD family)